MRPSRRATADASSVLHIPPRERPEPSCSHCLRYLASDPAYIACAHGACKSRIICVDCFHVGAADEYPHRPDHPYRIIEQVKTPFFEPDWSADDEMRLINALCEYGPYHWKAIAERVGKSHEKCERHYDRVYLTGQNAPIPTSFLPSDSTLQSSCVPTSIGLPVSPDLSLPDPHHAPSAPEQTAATSAAAATVSGAVPTTALPASALSPALNPTTADTPIQLAAKSPVAGPSVEAAGGVCTTPTPQATPLPQQSDADDDGDESDSVLADKIIPDPSYGNDTKIDGYMPRRADLEIEYDDNAEDTIADIVISENDTEEEKDLKLQLLQIYDKRLTRRDQMKQFIFQRDLIHVDKVKVGDRRHTRDEKELLARLQVFSRLLPKKEFFAFRDAIMREFRHSREIHRLQQCRAVGIKSRVEIDVYELERKARVNQLAKGKIVDWPLPASPVNLTPSQDHHVTPESNPNGRRKCIPSVKRRRTTREPVSSPPPVGATPLSTVAHSLSASPNVQISPLPPGMGFPAPLPLNPLIDDPRFRAAQVASVSTGNNICNVEVASGEREGTSVLLEGGAISANHTPAADASYPMTSRIDSKSFDVANGAVRYIKENNAANAAIENLGANALAKNVSQSLSGSVKGELQNAGNSAATDEPMHVVSSRDSPIVNNGSGESTVPAAKSFPTIHTHVNQHYSGFGPTGHEEKLSSQQIHVNIERTGYEAKEENDQRSKEKGKVSDILNKSQDSQERVVRSSPTLLRRERQHQRLLRSPYPQLRPMPVNGLPDLWKLTPTEQKLCSALHIRPDDFICQRDAMLGQAKRQLYESRGQPLDDKDTILTLRCAYLPLVLGRSSDIPSEDGTEHLPPRVDPGNVRPLQFGGELTATSQAENKNAATEYALHACSSEAGELSGSRMFEQEYSTPNYVGTHSSNPDQKCFVSDFAGRTTERGGEDVADATTDIADSANLSAPLNSGETVRRISVFVDATSPLEEDGSTPFNIDEVRMVTITPRNMKLRRNISTQCVPQDLEMAFSGLTLGCDGRPDYFEFENALVYNHLTDQKLEEVVPPHSRKPLPSPCDDGHHSSERGSSSYVGRFLAELGANAKIMIEVDTRGAGPSGGSADSIGDRLREALGGLARVVDGEESSPSNGVGTGDCGKESEGIEGNHDNLAGSGQTADGRGVEELAVISQRRTFHDLKLYPACHEPFTTAKETVFGGMTQVSKIGDERVVVLSAEGRNKANIPPLLEAKVRVRMVQVPKPEFEMKVDVAHSVDSDGKGEKSRELSRPVKSRKRPRCSQSSDVRVDSKRRRRTKRIVLSEDEDDDAVIIPKELVDEEILEEGKASTIDEPIKLSPKPAKRRSGRPRGRGRGRGTGRKESLKHQGEGTVSVGHAKNNTNVSVPEVDGDAEKHSEDVHDGNVLEGERATPKIFLRLRLKTSEKSAGRRRRGSAQAKAAPATDIEHKSGWRRARGKRAIVDTAQEGVNLCESFGPVASQKETHDTRKEMNPNMKESFCENVEKRLEGFGNEDVDGTSNLHTDEKATLRYKEQPVGNATNRSASALGDNEMVLLIPKESALSKVHAELSLGTERNMPMPHEGREQVVPAAAPEASCVLKGDHENVSEVDRSGSLTPTSSKSRVARNAKRRRTYSDDDRDDNDEDEGNGANTKRARVERSGKDDDDNGNGDFGPEQKAQDENVVWIAPSDVASEPSRSIKRAAGGRGSGRRGRKPSSTSGRGGRGRGSSGRLDGSIGNRGRVATRSNGERYSLRRKT